MADAREKAIQAVRTWLKSTFELPDAQVIRDQYGQAAGFRPAKPYFLVSWLSSQDWGDPEQWKTPGETSWSQARQAIIRVTAVGDEAGSWMEAAGLLTHLYADPDVSINEPVSGVMEMSTRHGDTLEYSAARDFMVSYLLTVTTAGPATVATGANITTESS